MFAGTERAVEKRPFPALLFWALLVPGVMFLVGSAAVIWGPRSPSTTFFAMFVVPMAIEAAAFPIALYLLGRGGYTTTANVLLTLLGAVPVVTFVGMALFYNLSHFHI